TNSVADIGLTKISPKDLRPRERTMGLQSSPQIWRSRIHFVVLALASTLRSVLRREFACDRRPAASHFLRGESGRWDFPPAHHQIFASWSLPAGLCQLVFGCMTISCFKCQSGRFALDQQILDAFSSARLIAKQCHVGARFGSYSSVSGFLLSACLSSACHPQNAARSRRLCEPIA